VVGIEGLTTDEPYRTEKQGRHDYRRAFEPHLIHAVVMYQWHGKDYRRGGKTVFLTNASMPRKSWSSMAFHRRTDSYIGTSVLVYFSFDFLVLFDTLALFCILTILWFLLLMLPIAMLLL
jgi:hypothetical protein